MVKEIVAVDFFAGAGGLSEGLNQAGFNVAAANEINEDAARTYAYNHPSTTMIVKDIKLVKGPEIIKMIGKRPNLVAGGPPCQGFSLAGKRDINDPRNQLFREYLRVAIEMGPEFILLENVVGLLSFDNGRIIASIEKILKNAGYSTSKKIFNAADFGVPQNRKRLFVLGSKDPSVTIESLHPKGDDIVPCNDAIGDLDFLKSGESVTSYLKQAKTKYQKSIRNGSNELHNHEAANHNKNTLMRFSMLKPGDTKTKLPKSLLTNKRTQMRLDGTQPARTVTTLPDDYIHPKLNRILTPRECARLQSFPDTYLFLGPRTTGGKNRKIQCPQYTQIGNSVPPLLAKAVGSFLIAHL